MENNELKEKVRKNIKEKIAVSNIRKELNMKKYKTNKMLYWITSSAAVVILGIGIIIGTNKLYDINKENKNLDTIGSTQEQEKIEGNVKTNLKVNKLKKIGAAKLDVDAKSISTGDLPNEFKFMQNILIPKDFKVSDIYTLYVRKDVNVKKYDILHDCVWNYTKNPEEEIRVALSTVGKPLRDYYFEEKDKISKIGDVELIISQYEEMYMVTFKLQNIYVDIETCNITENELVELLQSIIHEANL